MRGKKKEEKPIKRLFRKCFFISSGSVSRPAKNISPKRPKLERKSIQRSSPSSKTFEAKTPPKISKIEEEKPSSRAPTPAIIMRTLTIKLSV